jgi:hypothetical protein
VDRKILPVTLQNKINARLSYAFPLCVLLADKNLLPWFYTNYINIYAALRNNGLEIEMFDYYRYGKEDLFDNTVINVNNISTELAVGIKDLGKFLINQIDKENYVVIFLDEFFISDRTATKAFHFVHEFLLYGYDISKEKFIALTYLKDSNFGKIELDFKELTEAFNRALIEKKMEWIEEKIIMLIKLKKYKEVYPFDMSIIKKKLLDYYTANVDAKTLYLSRVDSRGFDTLYVGIESSKLLQVYFSSFLNEIEDRNINFIVEKWNQFSFMLFQKLYLYYEHKLNMYERLLFIENSLFLNKSMINEIKQYKKIVDLSENIKFVFLGLILKLECGSIFNTQLQGQENIKYFSNNNFSKKIRSIINIIEEIYKREKIVLMNILDSLEI